MRALRERWKRKEEDRDQSARDRDRATHAHKGSNGRATDLQQRT